MDCFWWHSCQKQLTHTRGTDKQREFFAAQEAAGGADTGISGVAGMSTAAAAAAAGLAAAGRQEAEGGALLVAALLQCMRPPAGAEVDEQLQAR